MFPLDLLLTYLAACLIVVIAPGPDNILAISRGLSQGRAAACLSWGSGCRRWPRRWACRC